MQEVGFKNIVLENILTDHENVGKVDVHYSESHR